MSLTPHYTGLELWPFKILTMRLSEIYIIFPLNSKYKINLEINSFFLVKCVYFFKEKKKKVQNLALAVLNVLKL